MSRALTRTALLALITALSGTAAAQETQPPAGDTTPKPTEPAQAPPDQSATPPPSEAPPPPPYATTPVDVGLMPVGPEAGAKKRMIFGVGLGYTGGGTIKHPELNGNKFTGEMLELAAGVELDPHWRLVLAFTSFQTKLERVGGTNQFQSASGVVQGGAGFHPLAGCADCMTNGGQGGLVMKQPFHVHTLGPRVDYLPFGNDSLFLGVTAGAAMMQDLDFRGGFAAAARAGFEWRPYSVFGISLEAGAHGQVYSDASAVLPYAAVQMKLLAAPPSSTTTTPTNSTPFIVKPPPSSAVH